MALNTINLPSFTTLPATTEVAAMSSFFATQTFFTGTLLPPATKSAISSAVASHSASTKTSVTSRSTSTKDSSSSTHTASSSSQTSAAAAPILSSSSESIPTSSITTIPTSSTLRTSFTTVPAAASTAGTSSVLSEQKKCSGMCSPGMQAAVAVPVALISLGFIIAFFLFARRRRRQNTKSEALSDGEPRGSKWTRHLRVFSFDAELLIGGRSSTAGSIRSHPTARSHPSVTSLRSHQPSVRSLESPAPPYRDALAGGNLQMSERPDSQLTAPPPYIANRTSHRPNSRLSAISRPTTAASDPFADPEEDDEQTSPTSVVSIVGQTSSAYHAVGTDDASFVSEVASETGSIRQAEVARRVGGARKS
jgi:hypothetical protein